jgi:chemotaxis protein methyltransferase CheR
MRDKQAPVTGANTVSLTDRDFKSICVLVYDLTGISLNDTKRELVVSRLSKRVRQLGLSDVGRYVDYVREQQTADELIYMLDLISTNLTSFWRESDHFDFVASQVLPKLEDRLQRGVQKEIRVWSAGCSTGEEPYGLAMLLRHHLDASAGNLIRILATDLSTRVLGIAKAGLYTEERVKNVPAAIRAQGFVEELAHGARRYRIAADVRRCVTFGRVNLMESWPMSGPFDIIFCRNVMIYFDKPTQEKLVNRFYALLRPGGYFLVGHSESLAGIQHSYRYVRPTIYAKSLCDV